MSYQTRLQRLQLAARTQKFASVIGHGTLINPLDPSFNSHNATFFKVPEGVSVVFISKPGYWVPLRTLKDDKMMDLLHSETKLQRFIAGTLPVGQTPGVVQRAAWNWKNHIYMSGMMCPNMGFELYDKADTRWGRWYNTQCGVWYPGTNRGAEYKGRKGTLKNLISSMATKRIFMVFGCRGDPAEYNRTGAAFNAIHGTSRGPFPIIGNRSGRQNYRVPVSPLVRSVRLRENEARRYIGVKRVRNKSPLRKTSGNSPTAKRARTYTSPPRITPFTFHPGVTPVTARRATPRTRTARRPRPRTAQR
jgi:hypothetical protein